MAEFASAVGTEVHKDHAVAIFHAHRFTNSGGFNKLIGLIAGIGLSQCSAGAVGLINTLAIDQQLPCLLDTIPAIITIHCIIAANQTGDTAFTELRASGFNRFDRRLGAAWRSITAI